MNSSRYGWRDIYARQARDAESEHKSRDARLDACSAVVKSRFGDGWAYNGHRRDGHRCDGSTETVT